MREQAEQTGDDAETQQDGSDDHQPPHSTRAHEQTRSQQTDPCQFDDFAMI